VEGRVSAHGFEIRKFVLYGNPYQTVAKVTQSSSLEAMLTRLAMPLLSLLLLFLFGAGTVWLGRWLARNEAEFLMRFLRETLEAEDHPGKQHRSQ